MDGWMDGSQHPSIHLKDQLRARGISNPEVLVDELDAEQIAAAPSVLLWWDAQPKTGPRAVGTGMLIHRLRAAVVVPIADGAAARSRRRFEEAEVWCRGKFPERMVAFAAVATCMLRWQSGPGGVTREMVLGRVRDEHPWLFETEEVSA